MPSPESRRGSRDGSPTRPQHEIRAQYTDTTVTVYQAYTPSIGLPAARDGRFPWMMYRCGWGTKEGQETVLAVEITREGFVSALNHAELSHYVRGVPDAMPPRG